MRYTLENSPNLTQNECDELSEAAELIAANQRDIEPEMVQVVEKEFWEILA